MLPRCRCGWSGIAGVLSVDLRTSGQQFDDSANQFRLAGYAQVDLYAERAFGNRFRVYGSAQNLLDQPVRGGADAAAYAGSASDCFRGDSAAIGSFRRK